MDGYNWTDGGKAASQAYWNALRKLQSAWRDVFGEELEAIGDRAMARYESAVEQVRTRLGRGDEGGALLGTFLDVELDADFKDAVLRADVDQLAPACVKQAIRDEIDRMRDRAGERISLRRLLRPALESMFADRKVGRVNVGANRHWPRLRQYLRELERETDWSPDGRGFRLVNAGGRGPVAQTPADPGTLAIVLDPDYLWPEPDPT